MSDPILIQIITSLATVLVGVLTLMGLIVTAYFAWKAKAMSQETHDVVNSRMDKFMKMAEESFQAKGVLQEKEAEKQRKKTHD